MVKKAEAQLIVNFYLVEVKNVKYFVGYILNVLHTIIIV